jgi:hypothetical protein
LWILQLDNLKTPDNLNIQMISQRLLNFAAAIGVLLGAIGLVRTGAIVVGAAIALTGVRQERRIERYLPLAIGVALIAVAIVLPHGR